MQTRTRSLPQAATAGTTTIIAATAEHRLIYKLGGDEIRVAMCRYHYV